MSENQRAGYTVTMFVVDVSKSMGAVKTVSLPPGPNGEERVSEMTHLQYALQYVKFKIQDMIYNGRKTEQCGVVIFGTEETNNRVHDESGGYFNVTEYIEIAHPTASTLTKLDELKVQDVYGDPLDGLVVAVSAQEKYLVKKKTWTRKLILVTDGEGPIELEDWEHIARKINENNASLIVVGVDFDYEEYQQEDKPHIKRRNEEWYQNEFAKKLDNSHMGNLDCALEDISFPDVKTTRSTLMSNVLRIGDCVTRTDEAMEIPIRTSKSTAITRPKAFKRFAVRSKPRREGEEEEEREEQKMDVDEPKDVTFVQLKSRTEYFVDKNPKVGGEEEVEEVKPEELERVDKEDLVKGFKYGTSYVPCPDGHFEKLPTRKGIDIIAFFKKEYFHRELPMGEIQYIWGEPKNASAECAISSIVQAAHKKKLMAIARWVNGDNRDAKMGVLKPVKFDNVHCFLWAPMPFADDVRKYTFPSLDTLITKKGEVLTEHPYIPTEEQQSAMDDFVDAMDLMEAGEKDQEGNRTEWFDPRESYNPSLHRLKQAMFHCAVVSDIENNPLPPPHPELLKYFNPPKKMVKKARASIDACIKALNVKPVPKVAKQKRKDGHSHAYDDDEEMLLLDRKPSVLTSQSQSHIKLSQAEQEKAAAADDSVTEDEDDDEMLLDKVGPAKKSHPLPTPARSLSPAPRRKEEVDVDDAMDVDPQRDPGRIIGRTHPLTDFKQNLKQGDVVTKVVEDMSAVIEEVVLAPFASRRTKEMLQCMTELRSVCLKEDEIDAWNAFLQKLKEKCLGSTPGNEEFWSEVQGVGRDLGLISDKEAEANGGKSNVSESKAIRFFQ